MKLPKLELKWKWSRQTPIENKDRILKQLAKGKKKYILQYATLYWAAYMGIQLVLSIVSGKLVTFVPGFQPEILFHADTLVSLATWAVLSTLFGYGLANSQWKKYESIYQKMQDEAKDDSPIGEASLTEQNPSLYIRNLQ